jgi:hypothetical protein
MMGENQDKKIINIKNCQQVNISSDNSTINSIQNNLLDQYNTKFQNRRIRKIYVSCTSTDLTLYRDAVKNIIIGFGQQYEGMEYMGSRGGTPLDECLNDVGKCDLLIGIYAWRYGFIPEGNEFSITECEYNHAIKLGIECKCYIADEKHPWIPELIEFEAYDKLKTFRDKILKVHVVQSFGNVDNLEKFVTADLSKLLIESEPVKSNLGDAKKEYKKILENKYSKLKMISIDKEFDIESIYIPLTINTDSKYLKDCHGFKENERMDSKSIEAEDLLNEPEKVSVVLGEPGMGKTTMLYYLAWKESKSENGLLPIFIKLSELSENKNSMEENLITAVNQIIPGEATKKVVLEAINKNNTLILLDGLDELSKDSYANVKDRIENFLLRHSDTRVIITSRKVGYEGVGRKIKPYEIDRLPKDKMKIYINKWFEKNPDEARALIKVIENKDSSRIMELGQNPFLLSLICLIFEESKSLPKRRLELYRKCAVTLLNLVKARKNNYSRSLKEDVLKSIAYYFFCKEVNEFPYAELSKIITTVCSGNNRSINEDDVLDDNRLNDIGFRLVYLCV